MDTVTLTGRDSKVIKSEKLRGSLVVWGMWYIFCSASYAKNRNSSCDQCAQDMKSDDTREMHAEGVVASGPITNKTTPTLCNFLYVDNIRLDQGRIGCQASCTSSKVTNSTGPNANSIQKYFVLSGYQNHVK